MEAVDVPPDELKTLKRTTKDLILQVHGFEKRLSLGATRRPEMQERARGLKRHLERFFEDVGALESGQA